MRLLRATVISFVLLSAPAAASCTFTSVQGVYDRSPTAVIATVVERGEDRVVLDVERTLKGTLAPGRVEAANPVTSVALGAPVGTRVGLGLSPAADGRPAVSSCNTAAPEPFALAAGPRARYVVAGGRTLLVLDPAGRLLRRFRVPGAIKAVAPGPVAGLVAHRDAGGVQLLDVVSGGGQPGPTGAFRPSRSLRVSGRVLRRDGRRVATLPKGSWTIATLVG
jgi:hypothetical protein